MVRFLFCQKKLTLILALLFLLSLGLSFPACSLAADHAKPADHVKQKDKKNPVEKQSKRPLRTYFKNVSNRISQTVSGEDPRRDEKLWQDERFRRDQAPSTAPASGKKKPQPNMQTPPPRPSLIKRLNECVRKMTYQEKQTSPWGMSYGVAAPNQGPAATQGPCTPWYGYGMGVPTYEYGWFGATYRPAKVSHTGYYGNLYQWGYRRGY